MIMHLRHGVIALVLPILSGGCGEVLEGSFRVPDEEVMLETHPDSPDGAGTANLSFAEGAAVDFGQRLTTEPVLTLRNAGSASAIRMAGVIVGASFSFRGGFPGGGGTCGAILPAGESCTLVVSHRPHTSGAGSVAVTFFDGKSERGLAVWLSGRASLPWTFEGALEQGTSSGFGTALAIAGDTLVVGAPSDLFDASGANALASAGAAYVYVRNGSGWTLQQKLVGVGVNGRMGNDRFGTSWRSRTTRWLWGLPHRISRRSEKT